MPEAVFIPSPVGLLQIIEQDNYITAIHFAEGDLPEQTHTLTELQQQCIQELQEYFNGQRIQFTFPVLQTGTHFQQRVWQQLQQIPFGKTISYMQLAIQLGDAKCIRAAGTANGKNNLAIVVPCHRVIGSNQSLTGYGGGLARKQWLLQHEAKWAYGVQQLSLPNPSKGGATERKAANE